MIGVLAMSYSVLKHLRGLVFTAISIVAALFCLRAVWPSLVYFLAPIVLVLTVVYLVYKRANSNGSVKGDMDNLNS